MSRRTGSEIVILPLILLGVAVALNNLAVALALGSLGQIERRGRIVLVFGAFEFTIPLVGLWLGNQVSGQIDSLAGWLAPALLALMGLWTVRASLREHHEDKELARRLTNWRGLMLFSLGLSVDNLVVGFGLGLRGQSPLLVATVIASFSVAFSWLGLEVGSRWEHRWENQIQFVAGVLLIGLALVSWIGW